MSKQTESPMTMVAAEALAAFRFVKPSSGQAVYADAADLGIGVTQLLAANGGHASIRLVQHGGTLKVTAAGAFEIGNYLYHAADGKVSNVPSGPRIGRALEAASADGSIVEMIYQVTKPEWLGKTFEAIADNKTLDAQDINKIFYVTADAKTVTLPATVAGLKFTVINGGAAATVAVNVSPNASDKLMGPDVAGTDNKDQINTKATAQRGDLIELVGDGSAGYWFNAEGIWAEEG